MAQSTNEMAGFVQTALEKMKMITLFSVGYESEKKLFEKKLAELAKIYQQNDLEIDPKMQFSVRFLFHCFNGEITNRDKVN